MSYNRKQIDLSISAPDAAYTPVFTVPDGNSKLTFQVNYDLSNDATLSLEQSADGVNFNPVIDNTDTAVTLLLDYTKNSATLNVIDLLAMNIRFTIAFTDWSTGSINQISILSV